VALTPPFELVAVEGIDGAGKTTVADALAASSGTGRRGRSLRPTAQVIAIFRELTEDPADESVRYQDVVPGEVRHGAYLAEAVAHLGELARHCGPDDRVVFDRWTPTWEIYCGPIAYHRSWYDRLRAQLPVPDALLYLRVDPAVAAERLRLRDDRWTRVFSPAELLRRLTRLAERYEAVMAGHPDAIVVDAGAGRDEVVAAALAAVPTPPPRLAGAAPNSATDVTDELALQDLAARPER
jgi:thymidylate kinase